MSEPMKSIWKKISKVMFEVRRVKKSGRNKFHNYDYATESDLLEEIRPILHENGLAIWTSIVEQHRDKLETGNPVDRGKGKFAPAVYSEFTKVKVEFTIACVDTGETITSHYWGEGQDDADKGLYKAYTGAVKYFLMKTFLIPTGDDPERDDSTTEQPQQGSNQQSNQQPNQAPALVSEKQAKMIHAKAKELADLAGDTKENVLNVLAQNIGSFQSVETLDKQRGSKAIEMLDSWIKQRKGQ